MKNKKPVSKEVLEDKLESILAFGVATAIIVVLAWSISYSLLNQDDINTSLITQYEKLCAEKTMDYSFYSGVGNICYKTLNNETIRFKILYINETYSIDKFPVLVVSK